MSEARVEFDKTLARKPSFVLVFSISRIRRLHLSAIRRRA
jgi:hypothetical protein